MSACPKCYESRFTAAPCDDCSAAAEERMRLPFSRCLVPEEAGDFSCYVREFPGCYSQGDTVREAYDNLENAMFNWLMASIRSGHAIPPPVEDWHPREAALAATEKA